ncbi:MAG: hypothetical protein K8S23_02940 [Candidatus Cloacimonetes bacterium]|nr:hypothetical protein [Candidatus Cloacimonadota bacterium]
MQNKILFVHRSARKRQIKTKKCNGRKIAIITIILLFQFSLIFAVNSASANYTLQQGGFVAGNDVVNNPVSSNYALSGSAVGAISGEDAGSTNFGQISGYYLGPIDYGILPPQNVIISISNGNIHLTWTAVSNATSYSVHFSDDPHKDPSLWVLKQAGITVTNWNEPVPASQAKIFYYVTANK